jgi:hypothetical protein
MAAPLATFLECNGEHCCEMRLDIAWTQLSCQTGKYDIATCSIAWLPALQMTAGPDLWGIGPLLSRRVTVSQDTVIDYCALSFQYS